MGSDFVKAPGPAAAKMEESFPLTGQDIYGHTGNFTTGNTAAEFVIKERYRQFPLEPALDPVDRSLVASNRIAQGQAQADDAVAMSQVASLSNQGRLT